MRAQSLRFDDEWITLSGVGWVEPRSDEAHREGRGVLARRIRMTAHPLETCGTSAYTALIHVTSRNLCCASTSDAQAADGREACGGIAPRSKTGQFRHTGGQQEYKVGNPYQSLSVVAGCGCPKQGLPLPLSGGWRRFLTSPGAFFPSSGTRLAARSGIAPQCARRAILPPTSE